MASIPPTRAEDAAARQALRELKRLATEALRRFEHDALIEATSSLAAIPTVLDPLLSYVQRTWVADAVQVTPISEDDHPGCYL
jgi:hypothetical protein